MEMVGELLICQKRHKDAEFEFLALFQTLSLCSML